MQEITLKHKEEFKRLIETYRPSDKGRRLLSKMPLVTLQGITSSGRNTIINYMTEHMPYHEVVSDTTRPSKLRNGKMEIHGEAYFFRTEEEVLDDLRGGMFLEAELIHDQQVSGVSIRELERAHASSQIPINEVAREGVANIRRIKPDTLFVFVVPPSYDVWLSRLRGREQMSDEEFSNRKNSAILEIQEALEAEDFAFVVNTTVVEAAMAIEDTRANGITPRRQTQGKRVAQAILDELRKS